MSREGCPSLSRDAQAGAAHGREIIRELEKRLVAAGDAVDRVWGVGAARANPTLVGLMVLAHEVSAFRGSDHSNALSLIRAVNEVARQVDSVGGALSTIDETLSR